MTAGDGADTALRGEDAGEDEDAFEERARQVVAAYAEDADLEAMSVLFNLLRTAARVVHDLETRVHRPLGLSWAAFRVLFYVWICGPISPREIARLSNVSRASISSVLNTLELRGLVVRSRTSSDRRIVGVELTERGREHIAMHWRLQHERERLWAAPLTAEQRRVLVEALRVLMHAPVADAAASPAKAAPRASRTP